MDIVVVSDHLLVQTNAVNNPTCYFRRYVGLLMLGSGTSGALFIEDLCFIRKISFMLFIINDVYGMSNPNPW